MGAKKRTPDPMPLMTTPEARPFLESKNPHWCKKCTVLKYFKNSKIITFNDCTIKMFFSIINCYLSGNQSRRIWTGGVYRDPVPKAIKLRSGFVYFLIGFIDPFKLLRAFNIPDTFLLNLQIWKIICINQFFLTWDFLYNLKKNQNKYVEIYAFILQFYLNPS